MAPPSVANLYRPVDAPGGVRRMPHRRPQTCYGLCKTRGSIPCAPHSYVRGATVPGESPVRGRVGLADRRYTLWTIAGDALSELPDLA